MTDTIDYYIKELEILGFIDPNCQGCTNIFYPQLREGKKITEIFAPRHEASPRCKSGKNPHCTCDTCF